MVSAATRDPALRALSRAAPLNLGLALVYFVAAKLGLALAVVADQVTLVWAPTGIALGAMLLLGRGVWPGILLGALAASLSAKTPLLPALCIAGGNTLEAVVGAGLLRRFGFSPALNRTRDAVALVVLGAGASTMLSATVGALSLVGSGLQPWERFGALWRDWWLGDAVGALIIVPVLGAWFTSREPAYRSPTERWLLVVTLSVVFAIAFALPAAAMANAYPLQYLVFPVVVWAALRFGPRGSSLVVLAATAVAIATTTLERGPFARRDEDALLLLQLFTAVVAVTGLLLSSAWAERNFAYQALAEQHRRKDEFLATLSHELRNPLAPIVTAVEALAQRTADPGEVERLRRVLDRQVHHLARLVDDLLDVSRIRTGKIHLHKEPLVVQDSVQSALEMSFPQAEERSIEVIVEMPEEGIELEADPNRLVQILVNLLGNAVKHGKPNGRIWLKVNAEEPDVVISVADDGRGMTRAVLRDAFELFAQGPAGSAGGAGLGVGLALVRQLVELHGGRVQAKSEGIDRGSEFIVRLPMRRRLPRRPAPVSQPVEAAAEPKQQRVMVVDDNVDAAEMLATMLEVRGHRVSIAHDGSDALEHARASVPDVMFLDIEMPKMNGYDVARAVRKDPKLQSVRLIALSGYGQKSDRARSKQAGFDLHIVKPVQLKAVYDALERGASN